MPKQRITKEMVVDAAFEIAKSSGMEQVLVRQVSNIEGHGGKKRWSIR